MNGDISCAILSGGRSKRMGRDKATLLVAGRTLLRRTYDIVRPIFSDIMVVSSFHNAVEGVDARIIPDVLPIRGTMTGVVSALLSSGTPHVFALGCDMPFLNEEAIRFTISEFSGEDLLIPWTDAGYEPLHAIYSRSCISPMLTAIERGHFKMTSLLPFLRVRILPAGPLFVNNGISVFTNVNTEEDLTRAEKILR
jgi:molybdopterin-guanine dinucleotide biosynthesis protein A